MQYLNRRSRAKFEREDSVASSLARADMLPPLPQWTRWGSPCREERQSAQLREEERSELAVAVAVAVATATRSSRPVLPAAGAGVRAGEPRLDRSLRRSRPSAAPLV